MQTELLEYLAKMQGMNKSELAKKIGIDPSTFYRKCNNQSEFTRDEIKAIKDTLNLTGEQIDEIFFTG